MDFGQILGKFHPLRGKQNVRRHNLKQIKGRKLANMAPKTRVWGMMTNY